MNNTVEVKEIDLEQERKEILKRYRKLLNIARPYLQDDDAKLIKKAFLLSAEAHKEMRRKSGEPYIYHPIAVAQICVEEIGLGATSIMCALLHDVVEDTEIELTEIEAIFGKNVAKIIDGLTKITGVFDYGSSQQAENFRKMLLTLSDDIRVILIKLADRLHNMRTLGSMPRDKQLKISSETFYLYAPLAHRLGLHAIKSELEDLCLKYTEPEAYKDIAKKLKETKTSRESFIQNFIRPIEKDLNIMGYKHIVKGRPKSIYSIYHKLKKNNTPFEEIYDLFAVRVILDVPTELEKSACWAVYSMVTDHYKPNPERLKDWISNPKSNGYESLHTTVMSSGRRGRWVEVQIRTTRMDEIAEKGFAAHWKYKGNDTRTNKAFESWLSQIREALDTTDKSQSAVELVDDIRSSLYNDEIFVYTPKGKLIVLKDGATALDFAFEIHSEVGARCIGAKVNNKLVPLSHKLKTGDIIECMTSAKQKPSEDWLAFVATTKAKARIKDYIKEANKQHVIMGRDMIEHRLKVLGVNTLTLEITNQLRAYFNAKDTNDLFYRFGKAYISLDEIKKWKSDREAHERKQATKTIQEPLTNTKNIVKELKKLHGDVKNADAILIGEDMDRVDYTLAKCCNPIAGDTVFGFVTINEGIKIHRTSCPNATELLSRHGDRVIKALWTSQVKMSFVAQLIIKGTDRMGLMNDVTRVISQELKVNIQNLSIGVKEGIFEGKIALMVQDTQHLETLVHSLEQVDGVIQIERGD
ncbi:MULTISPECIES: bifunctional (p)ppGpp synthetase/guanosine-3',5'-bis(diphosphate) 3'-pyrophosphohydrolase [unclassified Arcicella]|uniref:RelA/SpoT family protein n=1 Tax=unclassified Arcicella TaxID=2644986 RepID=UPI0028549240|nr:MULTISPECIES: bifunctional (p)ppGpp synthetase/guanosine-3',5'-bis(diphosphate) 3'-pyrophosphohydrolase [unclassified Arcicella]MDR6560492.1 GTP pyrophosphokinase [Arcicella sp. BE51]MDR6809902.1 GTP pyrophosphokinase [Arcicella sp. BE140]MDR6821251.1 GTP pyrophosphokinase [Arcicella sp. BE139]